MKVISAERISEAIANLCLQANLVLRKDVLLALRKAYVKETNKRARGLLNAVITNSSIAEKEKLAICQDTGMPVVFLEIGQDVRIKGDLRSAVNRGINSGYKKGNFRKSVVSDPVSRGKAGFLPAIIHTEIARGQNLKIVVMPKGFGCENKSQLKMFNPTAGLPQIKKFIIEAVKSAGPDACPPYIVGVGIGGTADYAAFLAKKALLKPLGGKASKLEQELLKELNNLKIGHNFL